MQTRADALPLVAAGAGEPRPSPARKADTHFHCLENPDHFLRGDAIAAPTYVVSALFSPHTRRLIRPELVAFHEERARDLRAACYRDIWRAIGALLTRTGRR